MYSIHEDKYLATCYYINVLSQEKVWAPKTTDKQRHIMYIPVDSQEPVIPWLLSVPVCQICLSFIVLYINLLA